MSKNICSVCNLEFEDEYFDKKQNKCILHCEKNDLWSNEQKYYDLFVKLFIKFIKEDRFNKLKNSETIDSSNYFIKEGYILLKNIIFSDNNSFLEILEVTGNKKILFEGCVFFKNRFSEYTKFKDFIFRDCIFYEKDSGKQNYIESNRLSFDKIEIDNITYGGLNCKNINISVSDSNIRTLVMANSSLSLNNTRINEELFYTFFSDININSAKLIIKDNSFIKNLTLTVPEFISIENSTIEKELRLTNSEMLSLNIQNSILNNGLQLNNSIVNNRFSLINSKIKNKKLDLSNTSLPSNINFLNAELEVENRETARIIKDSFEKQNNIIEANKFYALEMEKREKELEEDIKEGKNFFEWLVFKIHGLSSNHSQDWLLALFWIFIVGFIASYYDFNLIQNSEDKYIHYNLSSIFKIIGLIFIILFIDRLCKIKDKFINISYFIISSYLIYIYATEDYLLSLFSQTINPFSVMKTNDPINGIQLFFKIIIAYLIYQLIISIRQNTRRK
ncbi:hypothetical protein O8C97_04440 [Aliarcobacter butzleri]|uniref:hypothetical protein n=1 Tax=Aliarcobacter butzleri TaxID=28197 RepID=UPI00263CAA2F|nr:hypothetical protein [Aliarcobacter butzleri]MDN5047085.1 hypothetical protein [Aliarcobacter butzleri]